MSGTNGNVSTALWRFAYSVIINTSFNSKNSFETKTDKKQKVFVEIIATSEVRKRDIKLITFYILIRLRPYLTQCIGNWLCSKSLDKSENFVSFFSQRFARLSYRNIIYLETKTNFA